MDNTRYFTPSQVQNHNAPHDCWVSWMGRVYDLTKLIADHKDDPLIIPLVKSAGQDISNWFDPSTSDLKSHIHPELSSVVKTTPLGQCLDIPPAYPTTSFCTIGNIPWWKQSSEYFVGILTKKSRKVKIINMLTRQETNLEVCTEESISAIQDRYLEHNCHARAYVWKRLGHLLDMKKTLEENDIPDENSQFEKYGMDEDEWLPVLHVYFSDDLTTDPLFQHMEPSRVAVK